jgi:hypothetical protein
MIYQNEFLDIHHYLERNHVLKHYLLHQNC